MKRNMLSIDLNALPDGLINRTTFAATAKAPRRFTEKLFANPDFPAVRIGRVLYASKDAILDYFNNPRQTAN